MPVLSYEVHENILNWMKGSAFPSAPASLRLALLTAEPNPDGTGIAEPNGGHGYGRQVVAFGAITTDNGISTMKNSAPVVFGPASTSGWATATHVGLFSVGGDLLAYGPLPAQRTAPLGDTISFGAEAVQIRLK